MLSKNKPFVFLKTKGTNIVQIMVLYFNSVFYDIMHFASVFAAHFQTTSKEVVANLKIRCEIIKLTIGLSPAVLGRLIINSIEDCLLYLL